ncbi:hypothetical protein EON64_16555, partial [archaeon]
MALPIPEYFNDEAICALLNLEESPDLPYYQAFPLTCGVLIKMRSSLLRAYKRSECRFQRDEASQPTQLFSLVQRVVFEREQLLHQLVLGQLKGAFRPRDRGMIDTDAVQEVGVKDQAVRERVAEIQGMCDQLLVQGQVEVQALDRKLSGGFPERLDGPV